MKSQLNRKRTSTLLKPIKPPLWLERSLMTVVLVAGLLGSIAFTTVAASAASATATWTGGAGISSSKSTDWSNTANWSSSPGVPSGTDALSFPVLTSSACTSSSSTPADTCYTSNNNISGLTPKSLTIATPTYSSGSASAPGYYIAGGSGYSITLGSGGLTSTESIPGSSFDAGSNIIALPINLGIAQSWSVTGDGPYLPDGVTGSSADTLGITLGAATYSSGSSSVSVPGSISFSGDNNVGNVSIKGSNPSYAGLNAEFNGGVNLSPSSTNCTTSTSCTIAPSSLNATSGSVLVTDAGFGGAGTVGSLTTTGAEIEAGMLPTNGGTRTVGILNVAGAAKFDSTSALLFAPISGTSPGATYPQLKATGAVDLGGAQLQLVTSSCTPLSSGTLTLITGSSITGQLSEPNQPNSPIPNGGVVAAGNECSQPSSPTYFKINYTSTTVTATVTSSSSSSTTLYVSTTGSNGSSNNCQTSTAPCATIQYAVTQAETDSGAVVIQIAGGTYPEQVTIAPSASSSMTSLTLQGPTSGTAAVLEPTSALTPNVYEASTGHFFDSYVGDVSAIIGAQTGSTDSALTTTPAGNGASVTVANLTVDGSKLPSKVNGNWVAGIALINTSGNIQHNVVQNVLIPAALDNSAGAGIAIKSTASAQTVGVVDNTVHDYAGHEYVNLMAGLSGTLSATVTGNILTGDPATALSQPAMFGVVAGGLSSLTVSGNTISNFQSPWSVGAVWLDSQASGATCSVTGNKLTANDNGVDVHGAKGCTITDNTITAGSTGVEIGPGYNSKLPSTNTVVSANTITGTPTEGTTTTATYDNTTKAYKSTPAVAGVPVDGALVWDGTGNSVSDNAISGFASDVYVGEDPVYLNNTATWGSDSISSPYSGYSTGATVHFNNLGTLATPTSTSVLSYGAACLNSNGDCTKSLLPATNNWWGSSSGPHNGATNTSGTGVPVSANVNYKPWLASLTLSPSSQSVPVGSTATVQATLRDNTGATVSPPNGGIIPAFSQKPVSFNETSSSGVESFTFTENTAETVTVNAFVGSPQSSSSLESSAASVNFYVPAAPTAPTPISPAPPTAPAGSSSHASGSSTSSTGTASATNDNTSVSATGVGAVTVAQYSSNPVSIPSPSSTGKYFDVQASSGNSFATMTVKDCNLNGGNSLQWWNPAASSGSGAWEPVTPTPTYSAGPPACVSTVLTSSSSPSLSELTGTVLAVTTKPTTTVPTTPPTTAISGFAFVGADGGYFNHNAPFANSLPGEHITTSSIVGSAVDSANNGYWMVSSTGSVYAFGGASVHGSVTNPSSPVVGMAATPNGGGYWIVTSNGTVYAFGNAVNHGDVMTYGITGLTGSHPLNAPITGIAVDPAGTGYWLVAGDGGVFNFGSAKYFGNTYTLGLTGLTGSHPLNASIAGIASTPSGKGYWLVGKDGGVFNFGNASYLGSTYTLGLTGLTGSHPLNKPVVGIASVSDVNGHQGIYLWAADGGVFNLGVATYQGSDASLSLNKPIVSGMVF